MPDRGLFVTLQAIRRQLGAMPCELYLVRLIHHASRRAFPGERLWTATQLTQASVVRFLRIRNREGCDVFIQPYAGNHNAGYILLDLDRGDPSVVEEMRPWARALYPAPDQSWPPASLGSGQCHTSRAGHSQHHRSMVG